MILHQAIDRANQNGRLGLIVYMVPGFPNPPASEAAIEWLDREPAVSIIETTLPVNSGFSEHANDAIVQAHQQASRYWTADTTIPATVTPQLCVLYRQTVDRFGFAGAISRLSGRVAGIVLEWNEAADPTDPAVYHQHCQEAEIELVRCVGPWMNDDETRDVLALCSDRPVVYLMSAERTGGTLFGPGDLARCARSIRRYRPNAKIAAGFGISTPAHVRAIAAVDDIDAVIIGTAFLQALSRDDAQSYLSSVTLSFAIRNALIEACSGFSEPG